jgi:hypothetical protein
VVVVRVQGPIRRSETAAALTNAARGQEAAVARARAMGWERTQSENGLEGMEVCISVCMCAFGTVCVVEPSGWTGWTPPSRPPPAARHESRKAPKNQWPPAA